MTGNPQSLCLRALWIIFCACVTAVEATTTGTTTTTKWMPTCSQAVLNALEADDAREIERFSIIGENMECLEPKLREAALIAAIKARSTRIATVLIQGLSRGAMQVDERDQRGSTPLHLCAVLGYSDLMKLLLDKGANVTAVDALDKTALHLGVVWQNVTKLLLSLPGETVSLLLSAHDVEGNTALHTALALNYPSSAELIVSSSEKNMLRVRNNVGQTPLHFCIMVDIAKTLTTRGVNLTARDDAGALPLHTIAGRFNSSEVMAFLLEEGGGSINAVDSRNATPLHYACYAGREFNVKWLIENGADVEIVDDEGNIALMRGMAQGYLNLVKLFTAGQGSTPLHAGVELQRLDVVQKLVESEGIDVNGRDTRTGQSAMFPAASAGLLEIVAFLADRRAQLDMMDNAGWSVLATAIRSRQPLVAQLLLERGANASQANKGQRTPLHEAADQGDTATAVELLRRGVYVDAQDHLMRTPLHVAAKGASEIVKVLLLNGAQELPMRDRRMPLHIAAGEGGQTKAAEHLLRRRHEIDAREYQGDSPLIFAALHGHLEIVQLLLKWCANVRAQNSYQRTAVDYARDSAIGDLLENADVMEGRCQCDCGPYNVGVQFRTFGWSGGCTGNVMCRTGDGANRKEFSCQAPDTDVGAKDSEGGAQDSEEIMGRWTPSAPGLVCPTAVSHSEPQQHLCSLALFMTIGLASSQWNA